jgi:hypothetical protein
VDRDALVSGGLAEPAGFDRESIVFCSQKKIMSLFIGVFAFLSSGIASGIS